MAGADERRQRLPWRRYQVLLEGDALVARQDGLAEADQSIAIAHWCRNMGDLVAARFALLHRAAEALEGFEEEGFDIVRLKPSRLGPLHVFADAMNARDIHGVMRKRAIFEQILQCVLCRRHSRRPW